MDEIAYRAAMNASNPAPCVFEKALLARCAVCGCAGRQALAEREVVACTLPAARANCAIFFDLLRERARFALKLPLPGDALPHAAAMKLQCGGLKGLTQVLDPNPADVHRLVAASQERWGSLHELPWVDIVRAVATWQGRRRYTPAAPP